MLIRVQCPKCRAAYSVEGKHAGQLGKCRTCGAVVRIPTSNDFNTAFAEEVIDAEAVDDAAPPRRFAGPPPQRAESSSEWSTARKVRLGILLAIAGMLLFVLVCWQGIEYVMAKARQERLKPRKNFAPAVVPQPAAHEEKLNEQELIADLESGDIARIVHGYDKAAQLLPTEPNPRVARALVRAYRTAQTGSTFAMAISKCACPEIKDELLELTNEHDGSVVRSAFLSLARLKAPEAIAPLLDKVKPGHSGNAMAISVLPEFGSMAEPQVLEKITDPAPMVRRGVCKILTKIGTERSVKMLAWCCADSDKEVRQEAHKALIGIGLPAVPAVVELLHHKDAEFRQETCQTAFTLWRDHKSSECLVALGNRLTDTEQKVRSETYNMLGYCGLPAEPHILPAVSHENIEVRMMACLTLIKIKSEQSERALLQATGKPEGNDADLLALLHHEHHLARRMACILSARLKTPESLAALSEVFTTDKDHWVSGEAWNAIVKGEAAAEPVLIKLLKHSEPNVRRRACTVLGGVGTSESLEPLRAATYDYDHWVKQDAQKAYSQLNQRLGAQPAAATQPR